MTFALNATAADRFWPKVQRGGPDDCWEWSARRDKNGYGRFRPDGANTGDVGAHRVALALDGRPLQPGQQALHRCDNPPCVNPAHLFIGSNDDNVADKVAKGRQARVTNTPETAARGDRHGSRTHPEGVRRGVDNGSARLTEDDVRAIRRAHADGESQCSIARRTGVPQPHVSRIVLRRSWAHVA